MQGIKVVSLFFSLFILCIIYNDRVQCVKVKLPHNKRNTHVANSKNEKAESLSEKYSKSINFLNLLNEEAKQSTERLSDALDKLGEKISNVLTDKLVTFMQQDSALTDSTKESEEKGTDDVIDALDTDVLEETGVEDSKLGESDEDEDDEDEDEDEDDDVVIPDEISELSDKVTKNDLKELKKVIVDNTIHEISEDLDNWDLDDDKNSDLEEDIEEFSDEVVKGLVNKYEAKKLEKDIRKHDLLDFMNNNNNTNAKKEK